jgi:nitronate monooxygenase
MWPDARLMKLIGTAHPIVLAPMAGAMDFELAAAVSEGGGLGSLPCAMLTPDSLRDQFAKIRARTDKPVNVNFRPPDLTDFSMTPNRRLSAVRCQETDFRCC